MSSAAPWLRRLMGTSVLLLLLASVSVCGAVPAETFNVRWAPLPAEAPSTAVDVSAPVKTEAGQDVVGLLDEERWQIGPPQISRFVRRVRKALTPSGVENLAEILIEINPGYETLTLHTLRVWRNGRSIDMRHSASIRTIQQESDLERRVYRGTLTTYIVLGDVRVDDVVDLAYSVDGSNPALEGRIAGEMTLGARYPTRRLRREFVVSRARRHPLAHRVHGVAPPPRVTESPSTLGYTWDLADLVPPPEEDRVPSWYPETPWVEFSDFEGWADVVAWGLKLYEEPHASPLLTSKASELRGTHPSAAEAAMAALRFVQDDIRYLSMSVGPHSLRPHAPSEILEQRFGDCKDKSWLLVALLRRLGVEAYPALVSTQYRERSADHLPSPLVFDHVIVALKLGTRTLFVDPTNSHQGGGPDRLQAPDFGLALPIQQGTNGLATIASTVLEQPNRTTLNRYAVTRTGSAKLLVTTTYRGSEADQMRDWFARTPLSKVARGYLDYYASQFSEARAEGAPVLRDDLAHNVLVVEERYELPEFWKDGERSIPLEPIDQYLAAPQVTRREFPLALDHPVWVHTEALLELPWEPEIDADDQVVKDELFWSKYGASARGHELRLYADYKSRGSFVPTERLKAHLEALERARDGASYSVLRAEDETESSGSSLTDTEWWVLVGWVGAGAGGLGLVLLVPALRRQRRKRAFRRRRDGERGDLPGRPLAAASRAEARRSCRAWRCSCGQRLPSDEERSAWTEVRVNGAPIHVLRATCPGCGTACRRYFELADSSIAEERPQPTQGDLTVAPRASDDSGE